jgi:DDE superfamily endonuclease
VIAYRATLDVPGELVWSVAKLLLAERNRRGTPRGSRALTCFWQAVLGLRWFRDRTAADALARDHGISRATAYRYLDEVIAVLAEQAPDVRDALDRASSEGLSHVILDGKVIPADRCREKTLSVRGEVIDRWYSGKAHTHGGNIQALFAPDGFPLWVSAAEPGSVHDITAARRHALPALYHAATAGLPTLADPGYDGAGIGVHIPVKQPAGGQELDPGTRTRNALQRSLRCLGERGFALLTQRWRTLQHITASPSKISDIARAALVLTHFEHGHIK